ncbi:MAG TPA: AraC family transcriptional regulator [Chitinophagaceae bacterium]|nr:AraC family transcriptional regulator [Chitinophagaceae bacterium]
MKPLIEKLPLHDHHSFVARTHRTPLFEVPWHQHVEYELILITEGAGLSFVGNYVGEFAVGDLYFLGKNLPHTFQKSGDRVTSAVVVQFRDDFWGEQLLQLPESAALRRLLHNARHGLRVTGGTREALLPRIVQLEADRGFWRLARLCECLALLADTDEYETLSTQEIREVNYRDRDRIESIFQYTMDNFREPVRLGAVAERAGMSVPAFCTYFRKRTKKTYIDFVNEVRIGYACKQLATSEKSVLEICFESGFNTVAHFNRQFRKIKGQTPSRYRKALFEKAGI